MAKKNSRWAVNLTALVLAAGLLMGLLTGCPNGSGPNRPNESAQPNGQVQPTDPSIFKTDGHGVITGYTCDKKDLPKALVIPAKIGDEVITGIGYEAFNDCTGLTSLDLSGCISLTGIDQYAFFSCTSLTEVKLPASLNEIGWNAFKGCTGLTSLDLSGCTSLTKIGNWAFSGCKGFTVVKMPASLITIGWGAFADCTGLTSLDLSAYTSLTKILDKAFFGCTGLTEVKLPASLTEIGNEAFKDCPIETLYIGCDIKGTIIDNLTNGASVKDHLKNIKLGEGVRIIYNNAFSGCKALTSLDLSACTSLTKIDSWTFKGCAGLTEVKLPASLTKIGFEAFKGCKALTEVKLPASLTEIGKSAFAGCTGLTSAVFADTTSWAVYDDSSYSGTPTSINSSDLDNYATAAKYLREETDKGGYCDKWWKKD